MNNMKYNYHLVLLFPSSNKWGDRQFEESQLKADYHRINDGSVDFFRGPRNEYTLTSNLIASYPRQYLIIESIDEL